MSQHNNSLELAIAEELKSRGLDIYARPTKASGASTELGDVENKLLMVEAKQQLTKKHLTINSNVFLENEALLPYNSKKIAIMALENKTLGKLIALRMNDFFDLLERAEKND